jgi:uncharacterized membrane protein (UPF0127 family)
MGSNRRVIVRNLSKPLTRPLLAEYCSTFLCRLRGLTFKRRLPESESLLLVYHRDSRLDTSIHMLGVPMDLAVAWINSRNLVVDLPSQPARYVLEMSPARLSDFQVGDRVSFEEAGTVS